MRWFQTISITFPTKRKSSDHASWVFWSSFLCAALALCTVVIMFRSLAMRTYSPLVFTLRLPVLVAPVGSEKTDLSGSLPVVVLSANRTVFSTLSQFRDPAMNQAKAFPFNINSHDWQVSAKKTLKESFPFLGEGPWAHIGIIFDPNDPPLASWPNVVKVVQVFQELTPGSPQAPNPVLLELP